MVIQVLLTKHFYNFKINQKQFYNSIVGKIPTADYVQTNPLY